MYDHCNGEAERAASGGIQPPQPNKFPFNLSTLRLLRGLGFITGALAVITLGPLYFMRRVGRRMGQILPSRRRKGKS